MKLLSIQLAVLFALILNIPFNNFSVAIMTNCIRVISTCPEAPSPQLLFHFRELVKDFTSSDAFYCSYYLSNSHRRNTLNQKMDVIFISANLDKINLVTTLNLQACFLDQLTHRTIDHLTPVLHRKNQVIKKKGFALPFEDVFIHKANLRFLSVLKPLGFQTILFDPGASPEEFS